MAGLLKRFKLKKLKVAHYLLFISFGPKPAGCYHTIKPNK